MLRSATLCVVYGRGVSIPRDTRVLQNEHHVTRVYGKMSITWHACMAKWQDVSTHRPFLVRLLVNDDVTVWQNIRVKKRRMRVHNYGLKTNPHTQWDTQHSPGSISMPSTYISLHIMQMYPSCKSRWFKNSPWDHGDCYSLTPLGTDEHI